MSDSKLTSLFAVDGIEIGIDTKDISCIDIERKKVYLNNGLYFKVSDTILQRIRDVVGKEKFDIYAS